jgi:hypothetical protein
METKTSTCGSCKHWHPLPSDPHNLGAPRHGECRHHLSAGLVMQQTPAGVQPAWMAGYPPVPNTFPACGQHEAIIELGMGR